MLRRQEFVDPRGFLVHTDNIFDSSSWSEPVFFDCLGIDQDVSRRKMLSDARDTQADTSAVTSTDLLRR
jgi:hypothetical protein